MKYIVNVRLDHCWS